MPSDAQPNTEKSLDCVFIVFLRISAIKRQKSLGEQTMPALQINTHLQQTH